MTTNYKVIYNVLWPDYYGGGWGETPPHMIVKRFGCTTIHKKRYINASFIHSFIPYTQTQLQPIKNPLKALDFLFRITEYCLLLSLC